MRAYVGLRASDRELSLRAWLYRIAHNRCIDELRRPPRPRRRCSACSVRRHDPTAQAEQRESLQRLIADVRRLPDQQRSALLMRELGGMAYADLAAVIGVSVPAVKSLLVRARIGLAQAAVARDTACVEIQEELVSPTTAACARAGSRAGTCTIAPAAGRSGRSCAVRAGSSPRSRPHSGRSACSRSCWASVAVPPVAPQPRARAPGRPERPRRPRPAVSSREASATFGSARRGGGDRRRGRRAAARDQRRRRPPWSFPRDESRPGRRREHRRGGPGKLGREPGQRHGKERPDRRVVRIGETRPEGPEFIVEGQARHGGLDVVAEDVDERRGQRRGALEWWRRRDRRDWCRLCTGREHGQLGQLQRGRWRRGRHRDVHLVLGQRWDRSGRQHGNYGGLGIFRDHIVDGRLDGVIAVDSDNPVGLRAADVAHPHRHHQAEPLASGSARTRIIQHLETLDHEELLVRRGPALVSTRSSPSTRPTAALRSAGVGCGPTTRRAKR